ncbi:MAG: tryptophan-rich sensory protein [Clostridia bacterium]|nr:tryptophan-rich sensory protein [Clostridia bacterium]
MLKKIKPYALSILVTLCVGGLSTLITGKDMDIYSSVKTPPLSPPSWLFPVAWTVLYILMAVSFAMIYAQRKLLSPADKTANRLYTYNLILNFFWSIIFFKIRAFAAAFVWLCALWAVIVLMTVNFKKTDKKASFLLVPYLLWVTFAGYLNMGIFLLNRA